jgi:N-acetylneuraminate synthase
MVKPVRIGDRSVGPDLPCLVIAEAGVNHNGSLEMALRLVDVAADAGADIVKFQTFRSEEVVSPIAPRADYQTRNTGSSESQLEMVKKLELPIEAFQAIKHHCDMRGIVFLSTPFDRGSVDLLKTLDVLAFKVGSGELTNLPFLKYIAEQRKPLIVSTGMSTLDEVKAAVDVVKKAEDPNLVLLHCVSNYPASASSVNLRAMKTLEKNFEVPSGYSDHTGGIEISLAAAALGACVIEKHFTLDRSLPGPDHKASLEPNELRAMAAGIRKVQAALGDGRKQPAAEELNTAAVARRSLVAACDLRAGTVLAESMIAIRRPGTGLPPARLQELIGRRLRQDLAAGNLFTLEMLG